MKLFWWIPFSVVFLIQGCQTPASYGGKNKFSSSNDTLIIHAEKVKGTGLFSFGAGRLVFRDTVEEFQYPVTLPKNISDIKRIQIPTDLRAKETHFIDVICGVKDNEKIFIVDQNNNKDLTDDSIRVFQKMEWYSSVNSIKCRYLIDNDQKTVQDSSWVKIGTQNGNIFYGRDEHLTADFSLDEKQYKIGIIDQMAAMTFTYGFTPELALISDNSNIRDTLLNQDLSKIGEYLDLNGDHYRFDRITNYGKYVTLIKEMDFASKVGTQVGMIAPDFYCLSVKGDTIISTNLHDRVMIIANSCGCGGDKLSTEAFYEIRKTFGDKIYALRLDSEIERGLEGWHIDMEEKYNRDIYNKYRNAYCSRISYVIGKNGRIIDKFVITDWRSFLSGSICD